MDGSSTETEDPQHFEKAKPKKRAVKKDLPAKKRTKRNDADDRAFWNDLLTGWQLANRHGVGATSVAMTVF